MIMILSSKAPSPPDSLGLAADINGGVTTSGKKRGRISLREPFKNLKNIARIANAVQCHN